MSGLLRKSYGWVKRLKSKCNMNFEQIPKKKKKKATSERFPWSLRSDAGKERRGKKFSCWPSASSSAFDSALCNCEEECKQIKTQKKLQCLCIPLSFSSCLLSPHYHSSPHHLREVNDSAVKVESKLFDLDSKPAFLNKYSVARERWRVPSLHQITGYVWGRCFHFWAQLAPERPTEGS